ncbi:DUF4194 domain-containing protein [Corynebacterium kalidii]|uniref:DUF4194 domain-containing protein n=1 Tax=Corynebacterium kalidii TaxID=2931982 RepID=A0A9X1WL12_9CORY|nr:DUF4194 domain-containing protein [Corynebacterium kalidii]MCJ7859492.1 DUF4194 domain-containing protein [Corynebacterium kalidii]
MTEHTELPDALWSGDTGSLSLASRRALVQLLKGPLITSAKHPTIWAAVLSDESALRSRLAEVFLELVLDENAGIAFTRMVQTEADLDIPQVLRTEPLTHIDTLILLHLRSQVAHAVPGERVIVDTGDLFSEVLVYRSVTDTDEAAFRKRFNASVTRLDNKFNLLGATETEGRYEVSPALKHIFDPDTVSAITAEYRRFADTENTGDREDMQ